MPDSAQLITGIVQGAAMFWTAMWDAIAAEPKLQLMLVGFVALMLLGGGARGRARRAR